VKFFTLSTLATMAFIVTAGCSGQKIETLKDAICCEGGGRIPPPGGLGERTAAPEG